MKANARGTARAKARLKVWRWTIDGNHPSRAQPSITTEHWHQDSVQLHAGIHEHISLRKLENVPYYESINLVLKEERIFV